MRLLRAERCRLRALLAAAPLREDMREAAQGWRVLGGAVGRYREIQGRYRGDIGAI